MLSTILATTLVFQPAIEPMMPSNSIVMRANRVTAAASPETLGATRIAYRDLADEALASGQRALGNTLLVRFAYVAVLEGRNTDARFALGAVIRDATAKPTTRAYAQKLLDSLNHYEPNFRTPSYLSTTTFTHGTNGVIQH